MKMGTQQQHNNQDRYVNELVPPKTWTLLGSVWCITLKIWTQIIPFFICSA